MSARWRSAGFVAAAAAFAMLAYRFVGLELAPFLRDEPFLLEAARQQLVTGHWVLGSPIVGGQGIPYGPSVIWFYGVAQALLGPSPLGCIAAMCALLTLAHAALAAALTRMLRGGPWLFATVLALIASAPHQFFWSRLAWDQLVDACSALAVAILCGKALSMRRAALLGVVLGVGLSSHLMIAPLAVIVGCVLAFEHRRQPRTLLALGAAIAAAALLVNLPYLVYLSHIATTPGNAAVELHSVLSRVLQPARVASLSRLEYFFDDDWPRFVATIGGPQIWAIASGITLGLCAAFAMMGVALLCVRGVAPARRVGALAAVTWLGYTLFYAAKALPLEPHYQFPTWWVIPTGLAGALALVPDRRARGVVYVVVWLIALAQGAIVVRWMHFIDAGRGTRGIHYGATLADKRELVRQACAAGRDGETLRIVNHSSLFRGSLDYLGNSEPSCAGRHLVTCTNHCPPLTPTTRDFRLDPAGTEGGALLLAEQPR